MKLGQRGVKAYKKVIDTPMKMEKFPEEPTKKHAPETMGPKEKNTQTSLDLEGSEGLKKEPALANPKKSGKKKKIKPSKKEKGFVKVTSDPNLQKVAKLLLLLGKDEASRVLKNLTPLEVESVSRELKNIKKVSLQEAEEILKEFGYYSKVEQKVIKGGPSVAKSFLELAFGKEKATEIINKIPASPKERPFSFLQDIDPKMVLFLLKEESLSVLSVALPFLPPKSASYLLKGLQPEKQTALIKRISQMKQVKSEVIQVVEQALFNKLEESKPEVSTQIDGQGALTAILKFMDPKSSQALLSDLEGSSPELAHSIEEQLISLESIGDLNDRDLQRFLLNLADRSVSVLLSLLDEKSQKKVYHNISRRRRGDLQAIMTQSAPPSVDEKQTVAKEVTQSLVKGIRSGELRLDSEDWIV